MTKFCLQCGELFFVRPSRRDTAKFCSISCSNLKNKKGVEFSDEHKRKIGLANKGKPNFFKGKRRPQETRDKMSKNSSHWNKGIKQSSETILKRSKTLPRGDKNHLWRGGITPINQKIRTSLEYKLWRRAVFERDNFACIFCRIRSGNGEKVVLNADHIKPFSLYPELRFAIDNGRTLCRECHKTTDTFGNNIKKYEK